MCQIIQLYWNDEATAVWLWQGHFTNTPLCPLSQCFAVNLPLTYADLCSAWLIGGHWGTQGFDIFKRQQHQNLSDVFCFPFNFSGDGEATWRPRCMLSPLYLLVGFFQHGPVLLGNHTVNTVGFLEVLECHSVSHQRHQLSTTTHTHIQR